MAGDKLPVIEPLTVVEDELDAVSENRLGVLVDGLLHLEADGVERVGVHLPLALTEMERLCRVVVEEVIAADGFPQRRTEEQVGMEEQA